jgi:AcrR family transcriptional regulator
MVEAARLALEPRKAPVQARSAATVQAITEATIQVLLSSGTARLTTTRIAERAGVSVGTLYQYYPNVRSLLFAVLEDHLENLASAVEAACAQARGKPLAGMVKDVVEAFVDAKMRRADISIALYRIAPEVDGLALWRQTGERLQKAMEEALRAAPDAVLCDPAFAIQMMFAAMAGTLRSVLEAGGSPAMVRDLRTHLVVLCQSYMAASVGPRPAVTGAAGSRR